VRVFAIFFHPGSNFTAVGGAEKRFLQVLKVWERKGIETTIVETRPKLVSTCCPSFEEIEIGYPASSAGKGLYSIYLEWALWVAQACLSCPRIVKRNRQDLILAPNNTLPNLFVAYFVHVLSRVPLAVTVHHFDFPEFQKRANVASTYRVYKETGFSNPIALIKALTFSAMLAFVRRSDVCITVSNFTAEFLMKNGISQDKIRVSGNGVDTALIERFKAEKKVYDGIFVGRISRDKGIFDLVQIWKRVTALKPDSKLVVVGQGPDSLSLKRTVEDNGMSSNIMLKGRCNDAELYAHMKASKVFLFPSRFEGWGLAVGEALACGLPAVCYGISALREVFGKCSSVFFIPTGDTVQFAETVGNILNEDNLPELETASKEYAKHFSWEKVALNDLQIIRTVSRY
jgi:glycosyltransferase involved in cell wall biosynthesis